ncbi:MAG: hypothetical protein KA505_06635 [Xanthomonadales bacterium]|nr:hypothetical protein [Xanthomonadales bacterium]MBP7622667.1 hypothetical protein [Xanthomonadales bacterium]
MSVVFVKRFAVVAASLLSCSCMVYSLKANQPATTMRVRIVGATSGEYAMRLSGGKSTVSPDARGVFTLELPEVEGRCIREFMIFGHAIGHDPVPEIEIVRNDSTRVRGRVPITELDELPTDADGVRLLK